MSLFKFAMTAGVVAMVLAGTACSDGATAEAKKDAATAADKTKALAGDLSAKTGAAASEAGAEVTDGWITTKVKAKFADEKLLEGNKISAETTNKVVSLRGSVLSRAAKDRAVAIAHGTEGVKGVVDLLVVE